MHGLKISDDMEKLISLAEQIHALPITDLRIQAEIDTHNAITHGARREWGGDTEKCFELARSLEDLVVQAQRMKESVFYGAPRWTTSKTPQVTTCKPKAKCKHAFSSDGGACRKCGMTVLELLGEKRH